MESYIRFVDQDSPRYVVRIPTRAGGHIQRCFDPDRFDNRADALAAARAWRNQMARAEGIDLSVPARGGRARTFPGGPPWISLGRLFGADRQPGYSWIARPLVDGRRCCRRFSVARYGYEGAFRQALGVVWPQASKQALANEPVPPMPPEVRAFLEETGVPEAGFASVGRQRAPRRDPLSGIRLVWRRRVDQVRVFSWRSDLIQGGRRRNRSFCTQRFGYTGAFRRALADRRRALGQPEHQAWQTQPPPPPPELQAQIEAGVVTP
jgi:hypothetical protein